MKLIKKLAKHFKPKMAVILPTVLLGILIPLTAFAATTSAADEAILKLQEFVNMAFGLVHAIFWPILLLIGSLMDNDLIFGPDIGERLREIWVVMRNIVNIAFVFILLIIAFYNVTGFGGEGNFALKSILPKFVIALIAVNFSFMACKVILDASNVVAMSVYDIVGSYDSADVAKIKSETEVAICQNAAYFMCMNSEGHTADESTLKTAIAAAGEDGTVSPSEYPGTCKDKNGKEYKIIWITASAPTLSKIFCCETEDLQDRTEGNTTIQADKTCTSGEADVVVDKYYELTSGTGAVFPTFNSFGTDFFKKVDQNNIGIVMAINLGGINSLTQTAQVGSLDLKELTMNGIFSIIMYLVFGFAYVALFCVLLARLVVLWFVIALSPIIALTTVLPQIGQYASELKLGEKFIQHLMAPIVIGLSMSIGYIMIDAMKDGGKGGIDLGGAGNLSYSTTVGDSTGTLLTSNISDIHQLMLACLAVAVVWFGVFGAADKTLANSVTNKIKEAGTSAAKFVASLPKYMPIMPMMTGSKGMENYSFSEITGIVNAIKGAPESRSRTNVNTWIRESGLQNWMNGPVSEKFEQQMQEYRKELAGSKEQGGKLKEWLAGGELTESNFTQLRDELMQNPELKKEETNFKNLAGLKAWVALPTGRAALTKAYPGADFSNATVKEKEATEGSGEAGTKQAAITNIFNSTDQTPQQKVTALQDKTVNGGTSQQQTTDLTALVDYLAKPENKNKTANILVMKDGKLDLAASKAKMEEDKKLTSPPAGPPTAPATGGTPSTGAAPATSSAGGTP